jgi:putative heme transporter
MTPTDPTVGRLRIEIAPKTLFLILGIVAGIWILGQLTTVLSVMTVALVLVGTFDPLVAWLERRGLGRGRALVLVFVAATLALAGVVLLMIPPLLSQLLNIIERAPQGRAQLIRSLQGYSLTKPLIAAVKDLPLDNLVTSAGKAMIGFSTQLFMVIGLGISTLFLAIYLLADPVRAKGLIYAMVARHHHVKLAKILLELKVIVGGYMRGQLITSLSIAVFVFILLTVTGADNALPIALFAGLTDIIPFVGGYVASTPVVFAVLPNGTTTIIVVVGLMILYQEFESRILVPRVYGRVLRLPPAIVLVALLVGGTLAGILGALLALPIAAGVQMLIHELRVDLPGAAPASDETLRRDERATEVYEHLSEGTTAADAGVIADEVATMVKQSEDNETPPVTQAVTPTVLSVLAGSSMDSSVSDQAPHDASGTLLDQDAHRAAVDSAGNRP